MPLPQAVIDAVSVKQSLIPQEFVTSLSLHRGNTLIWFAMFTSYWTLAFSISLMDRQMIMYVLIFILASVMFQACYGIIAFSIGQDSYLGFWDKVYYRGDVTGTFVNRNHYASFLGQCWVLSLALAVYVLKYKKDKIRVNLSLIYTAIIIMSLIIGFAILGTHSRMGLFVAIFGLFLFIYLDPKFRAAKKFIILYTGILFVFLIGGIWYGVEKILNRIANLSEDIGRFEMWQNTFDFPSMVWMLGVGAGAFEQAFVSIQKVNLIYRIDYLHNEYLQFLIEFGIIQSICLLIVFTWFFFRSYKWKFNSIHYAAIAVMMMALVHSMVDFILHIPAVAMIFWICLGIVLNQDISSMRSYKVKRYRSNNA